MATVKIDTRGFEAAFEQILAAISDKDALLRPVAVELAGIMNERIHDRGEASDGSLIGQYSSNYLRTRENRGLGNDSKVILVFTRKLSNSWGAFATDRGWGVGFIDDSAEDGVTSRKKVEYAEQHFGKPILQMTAEELQYAEDRLQEIANDLLSPYAT